MLARANLFRAIALEDALHLRHKATGAPLLLCILIQWNSGQTQHRVRVPLINAL